MAAFQLSSATISVIVPTIGRPSWRKSAAGMNRYWPPKTRISSFHSPLQAHELFINRVVTRFIAVTVLVGLPQQSVALAGQSLPRSPHGEGDPFCDWQDEKTDYQRELAHSYFALGRNYYDIDRRKYGDLMEKVFALQPLFRPRESSLYNVTQRALGLGLAESRCGGCSRSGRSGPAARQSPAASGKIQIVGAFCGAANYTTR